MPQSAFKTLAMGRGKGTCLVSLVANSSSPARIAAMTCFAISSRRSSDIVETKDDLKFDIKRTSQTVKPLVQTDFITTPRVTSQAGASPGTPGRNSESHSPACFPASREAASRGGMSCKSKIPALVYNSRKLQAASPKRKSKWKEEEPWPYSHDAFRIRCTVCTCAPQRALRIRLPASGFSLWTGSLPCSPTTGFLHGQFRLKRQNPTDVAPVLGLRSPKAEAVAHSYPAVPHAGHPLGQPLPAERTPFVIRPTLGTGGSVWRYPA